MTVLKNDWYLCDIDSRLLRNLAQRSNKKPLIWFGSYFLQLVAFGAAIIATWRSLWSVNFVIAYGLIWSFAASGVHETGHNTPFRKRWLNKSTLWMFGRIVQIEPIAVNKQRNEPDYCIRKSVPKITRLRLIKFAGEYSTRLIV